MQVMHFFLLIYLPILLETLIVNISLICTLGLFDRRVGSFFPPPTTSQSHHSTKVASPFPHHTHGSQATADHGGMMRLRGCGRRKKAPYAPIKEP